MRKKQNYIIIGVLGLMIILTLSFFLYKTLFSISEPPSGSIVIGTYTLNKCDFLVNSYICNADYCTVVLMESSKTCTEGVCRYGAPAYTKGEKLSDSWAKTDCQVNQFTGKPELKNPFDKYTLECICQWKKPDVTTTTKTTTKTTTTMIKTTTTSTDIIWTPEPVKCLPCTEWSSCTQDGKQYRTCQKVESGICVGYIEEQLCIPPTTIIFTTTTTTIDIFPTTPTSSTTTVINKTEETDWPLLISLGVILGVIIFFGLMFINKRR